MKAIFKRLLITNWPRKIVAFIAAVVIWFLVYQSMTITRTIPDVPVRITNLPLAKTVEGLLPNGQLKKRIPVTITGRKSVVEEIRSGDIEIVINNEGRKDSWIASISKKNLVSLVPNLNLQKYITVVSAPDIYIKISTLMTEEIPVTVREPIGEPPKNYQFLDVWPKTLMQTVSGPQEHVRALQKQGLELTFNLSEISKEELDHFQQAQGTNDSDEVSFFVPNTWKEVSIPFRNHVTEPLNDPRANFLRIDFLRTELIPLPSDLPVTIFYPLQYSKKFNLDTLTLATNDIVAKKNGIPILAIPLFAKDVSHLFLDVVKDSLLAIIITEPQNTKKQLHWTVEVVDQENLEDTYVARSLHKQKKHPKDPIQPKLLEAYLRHRFRTYVLQMRLYTKDEQKLHLSPLIKGKSIVLYMHKR